MIRPKTRAERAKKLAIAKPDARYFAGDNTRRPDAEKNDMFCSLRHRRNMVRRVTIRSQVAVSLCKDVRNAGAGGAVSR